MFVLAVKPFYERMEEEFLKNKQLFRLIQYILLSRHIDYICVCICIFFQKWAAFIKSYIYSRKSSQEVKSPFEGNSQACKK